MVICMKMNGPGWKNRTGQKYESGRSKSMIVDGPQVWKRMVQNIKLDRPRVLKWTAYKYERGRFKTTVLVFQNRREMYGYKNCKSRIHLNSF